MRGGGGGGFSSFFCCYFAWDNVKTWQNLNGTSIVLFSTQMSPRVILPLRGHLSITAQTGLARVSKCHTVEEVLKRDKQPMAIHPRFGVSLNEETKRELI